ncbi:GGDEF domain-containing protein [Lysobacter sp. TY2-98]|uniref:GGDEF domain-containing protein n=1 Tax=Lysobacter sp. TY2-98 TaxID=2290922 RepID=UPI0013B38F08|nr:GGDEF domain-containing protein [Lysobacter sp. TY2-98]
MNDADRPRDPRTSGRRLIDLVASGERRRRLRLVQWLIATLVYAGTAMLLLAGVHQGWMCAASVHAWMGFIAAVQLASYIALRSGWSERSRDPSLTIWQLGLGVVAVNWGYLICGPMRTSALFPLMVIFAFGAFALRWRQIAMLTAFAVASLVAAVALRTVHPEWATSEHVVDPFRVDVNNVLMILVVLPALAVIAARLSSLRQKLRDQRTALGAALAQVERLAVSDELTGLPNRRSMQAELERSIATSERGIAPFCVGILDIDHFKAVNDELGHAAGDAVLRNVACLGREQMRGTDVLGRWGGEEFLLVTPGGTDAMTAVLARIRKAVAAGAHPRRRVTLSAGVAVHRAGEDADALLARADRALYRAKHAGRDQVAIDGD